MTAVLAPAPWRRAAAASAGPWRFGRVVHEAGVSHLEWVLKRNCSMSPAQVFGIYLSLCAVSLAIAGAFAWQGATPVLTFAAVELTLVGVALAVYARHAADQESITLAGASLTVSHRRGSRTEHTEFRAAWVRVEPSAGDRSLVELSGDGRSARVGRYLRPEWRQPLAQELRTALRMYPFISDPQ
ncbi:MAG TPA: DUF2244 domain-containing protein [Burkholderiaceae bacterium]|nr:DUF2244 domain-containing protein [Burkholderiaceae bacterium]